MISQVARSLQRAAAQRKSAASLYNAHMSHRRSFLSAAAALALALAATASAQDEKPPDPSDVADGMRLFETKGNCQARHGWAGDGRKTDSQMPDGPNLRESKLNRAGLILAIKCGRLNSQMPRI